eukprot:5646012-Amphidinium_carterae.1
MNDGIGKPQSSTADLVDPPKSQELLQDNQSRIEYVCFCVCCVVVVCAGVSILLWGAGILGSGGHASRQGALDMRSAEASCYSVVLLDLLGHSVIQLNSSLAGFWNDCTCRVTGGPLRTLQLATWRCGVHNNLLRRSGKYDCAQ